MSTTGLCLDNVCLTAAARILGNLAPNYGNYDPCTQFEEMVCYGFRENNANDTEALSFIEHSDEMNTVDKANFRKLQQSYNACMDTTSISEAGISPLISFISEIVRLFPVDDLTSRLESDDYEKLWAAILYLETFSISTFATLDIWTNQYNSVDRRLILNQVSEYLPDQWPDQHAFKHQLIVYGNRIATVLNVTSNALGSELSLTDVDVLAARIVDLEVKLYSASTHATVIVEQTDGNFTPSLDEVANLSPVLNYKMIILGLLPDGAEPTTVSVASPMYFKLIGEIVEDTPKATLQNWLAWRAIMNLKNYVSSPNLVLCVSGIDITLTFILRRFYISSSFSSEKRAVAAKMLSDVRTQFINRLESLTWMSDEVKKRAVTKVNNVQETIGYPSSPNSDLDLFDAKAVAALYQGQNITASYFANQISYQKWHMQYLISKLPKRVDRGDFPFALDAVNAYYAAIGNNIVVPAGILQAPIFDPKLPSYAIYGSIGTVLGHELTHGFDDRGRLFDETGSRASWWDDNTVAEFKNLAQCFIDQYNNFTYPSVDGPRHVDGVKTLGENLADAGGLHTAYESWISNRGALEPSLPNLEYFTHEQLFYIFYANMWCSSFRPAKAALIYPTDIHSPPMTRIQGMMQNSRGFREAFNCPSKDPVCELW
ncbi:zincin [Thozetella sp. PMI_491]|nr:zincin [Thozetella sp. PMI_491]